jgi:alpha-mannosidase
LIATTGLLPGWHPADEPPDPTKLDGELVLLPSAGRKRLASDWCERFRASSGQNPPLVEAVASREATLAAALDAVSFDRDLVPRESAADFLALGYAHLQVELLTRAMRYTSVLDTDQFADATVAAASAALVGNRDLMHTELARAFDLLTDARNHVYAVDFYIVDLTLCAASTLGEPLRTKLASGSPTSVLLTGEMLEQMAEIHPGSLAELRRAIAAGTACVIGGDFHGGPCTWLPPEAVLNELIWGQERARKHLEREFEVFGQFAGAFTPQLPEVLKGIGFRGALHAAFDGTRLPKADQCKTWWGPNGAAIQALATTPLDVAQPETWLRLAERIGDTIARDHVATILLAGWPGAACEYYDDLCRAARFGPVLGKLVTLDEYFRVSREPDEWTTFHPREYPFRLGVEGVGDAVEKYRGLSCEDVHRVAGGLAAAAGLDGAPPQRNNQPSSERCVVINPLTVAFPQIFGFEPINFDDSARRVPGILLPEVPACGYATLASAAHPVQVALAEGRTLRNERLLVTVSETTGGIQSLRTHGDRSTRVSQRLVFRQPGHDDGHETRMVADQIEINLNDTLVGQITSNGRLLDRSGHVLARFRQAVRVARGLPVAIVDVQLEVERPPEGDAWTNYIASRIAWADDAIAVRRGVQWMARETSCERIESPEWVEIDDGIGTVTCFALGLPFHRRAGSTWLDSLLLVAGTKRSRFQFALGIDEKYPTQTALGLVTGGRPYTIELPDAPSSPTGWFLHIAAPNVVPTHIEPLATPQSGIRLRLLETAGRDTRSALAAFRPFQAARTTDFRGQSTGVLSMANGRAGFEIGAYRWIQIEAEW